MKRLPMPADPRQRLLVELGIGVLCIALLVLVTAWPLYRLRGRTEAERDTQAALVREAETLLAREAEISAELDAQRAALRADFAKRLAPDGNALVWATDQVTTVARAASLPVESISEVRLPPPPWERPQRQVAQPGDEGSGATRAADRPRKRVFRPYAVEVVFNGGLHALLRFMTAIESNSLLQVVGLSIAAEERAPEQHRIRLILQWLTYTPLSLEAP